MMGWQDYRIKDLKANINSAFVDGPFGSNLKTEHFVDDGDVYVIDSGFITSGDFFMHREFRTITKEHFQTVKRSQCKENDIIIAKIGANFGMSAILPPLDKPSLVSGNTLKLTINRKKYDLKFIHYVFLYLKESGQIDILVKGSAQPALSMGLMNDLIFSVPDHYKEQTAIVQYLNNKTQSIDKKINLLSKKADYYKELRKSIINDAVCMGLDKNVKLKESGVEWVSKIPQHWEVKRFKDVVAKYTTGGTPSTSNTEFFNGTNTWICISDISDAKYISNSKMKLTDEALKSANIIKTPKGSLLYSFKLSIGKMAFVTKDVYTNEAILSIFPNKNIDLEYYYFMLPMFMLLSATENIYGAKMLNQKLIASAFVLHPPKEEQSAIGAYLDEKTQKIDAIVTNIRKQVETLKELRKTLINDVVTGKIKIID